MNYTFVYLFVNTYTGECRWLSLEDGNELDNCWELDPNQAPRKM
jgi:hypothetical protein